MIRKIAPLVAAVTLASAGASHAAQVVTFAGLGPTVFYGDQSLMFSASGGGALDGVVGPNGTIGAIGAQSGGSRPLVFFSSPFDLQFASIELGDADADNDTLFFEVFDVNGASLGSLTQAMTGADTQTLLLKVDGIRSGVFGSIGAQDGSTVIGDNFTFAAAGVPEPATWAMMIMGFGLAGSALRRRHSYAAMS